MLHTQLLINLFNNALLFTVGTDRGGSHVWGGGGGGGVVLSDVVSRYIYRRDNVFISY